MQSTIVLSATALLVLILVLMFLYIFRTLIREQKIEREMAASQIRLILQSQSQESLISLLGKTVAMLSAKDPMSFQAIQAMDSGSNPSRVEPKDNSGQGEYLQWVEENDELTPAEKEIFREVHYDG